MLRSTADPANIRCEGVIKAKCHTNVHTDWVNGTKRWTVSRAGQCIAFCRGNGMVKQHYVSCCGTMWKLSPEVDVLKLAGKTGS